MEVLEIAFVSGPIYLPWDKVKVATRCYLRQKRKKENWLQLSDDTMDCVLVFINVVGGFFINVVGGFYQCGRRVFINVV